MKKLLISTFLLIAVCMTAWAQSTIKVEVPGLVAADEQFNVTFVVEGESSPSSFNWEPGEDFQLVWGPQKGSSTSISIVNGKRTSSSQTSYTYILLPKKTGKFQIAPATATVKGSKISSSPRVVEVVSNGASTSSSQSGSQQQAQPQQKQSAAATGTVDPGDLFMRLTLSKTKAVVGEPINATLKLYQRVNIAGFEDAHFPSFNGFWSQEVQTPTNIEFHRESIGDMIYNAAVLRSYVLIPQQSGDLKIDPAELVCLVNVRDRSASSGSIFDSFFQNDYKTIRKRVSSSAVTVHVSALPAGAPASFGGGVGQFSISAKVTRDSLKAHDAASLVLTVSGRGNVSLLEAPKVQFPYDFDVYDTKTSENTSKGDGKTSGSKTFEYPFIPRSHGMFEIPSVAYSYYDVNAGRYVTLRTDPIVINVAKGRETESAAPSQQLVPSTARRDVKDLGSDIRFIATRLPKFFEKDSFFVGSALFYILIALILLLTAVVYFGTMKIAARRADVVSARTRGASKKARKRLSQAGSYLAGGLVTAFYEELHKALLGFISDKLSMPVADLSKDNISTRLSECAVPDALVSEFIALLDECEFARYSSAQDNTAMNTHYERAVNLIAAIDSSIKKPARKATVAGFSAMLLLFLLMPVQANAAVSASDSLWYTGTAQYSEGEYEAALQSWEQISQSGMESADLYYNMGNACFKSSDIAHAILCYERALKLDPSHGDARANLEFANAQVMDKIDSVPEFFLSSWWKSLTSSLTSGAWAVIFLVLFALAAAMLLVFLLSVSSAARRIGFFSAIAALVLALFALSASVSIKKMYQSADRAVVTAPVCSAQSSPSGNGSTVLFVIHEGTVVKMLDEVGEWSNIELVDGRQGWIKTKDVAII